MNKVYLIILEWSDGWDRETEIKVANSFEKAKKILQDWVCLENQTSWLAQYEDDEMDTLEHEADYYHATHGEYRTTISIEGKEIEE